MGTGRITCPSTDEQCTAYTFQLLIKQQELLPAPLSYTIAMESSGELELLQTLEGHTDRAWNVAWSPSGMQTASIDICFYPAECDDTSRASIPHD